MLWKLLLITSHQPHGNICVIFNDWWVVCCVISAFVKSTVTISTDKCTVGLRNGYSSTGPFNCPTVLVTVYMHESRIEWLAEAFPTLWHCGPCEKTLCQFDPVEAATDLTAVSQVSVNINKKQYGCSQDVNVSETGCIKAFCRFLIMMIKTNIFIKLT